MSRLAQKHIIYLDNAASTPIHPRVKEKMLRSLAIFGNPSSFNDLGRMAKKELEDARKKVANFIGARQKEIVFTSSGSEANNLAILGIANLKKSGEGITTLIEHSSVLRPFSSLKKRGWLVEYLKVDKNGFINPEYLKSRFTSKTAIVSVIYANNEIGTIQPIKKISKIIQAYKKDSQKAYPLFHVDACQAAGYLDMNVNNLGVDLMTFNGSKIYGPKGAGVLYVRSKVLLEPLILGGDQEEGMRAGTENLLAIVGLAEAISLIKKNDSKKLVSLRDYFLNRVKNILPDIRVNGPQGSMRLPNNINISIPGLDSNSILLELDKYGIYASAGSACTARSTEPPHVLKSIGLESKYLNGTLRFSLGEDTTKNDIDYVLRVLPKVVKDLERRYNEVISKNRRIPSP